MTGAACINRAYNNLAVIEVDPDELAVIELARGGDGTTVRAVTEPRLRL